MNVDLPSEAWTEHSEQTDNMREIIDLFHMHVYYLACNGTRHMISSHCSQSRSDHSSTTHFLIVETFWTTGYNLALICIVGNYSTTWQLRQV